MDINEMCRRSNEIATDRGWNDHPIPFGDMTSNLHAEVSEVFESYRNNEPLSWIDDDGKPQGIASEFADIVIRVGHYSVQQGIDLEREVEQKMKYNATRPYRHGGKRA